MTTPAVSNQQKSTWHKNRFMTPLFFDPLILCYHIPHKFHIPSSSYVLSLLLWLPWTNNNRRRRVRTQKWFYYCLLFLLQPRFDYIQNTLKYETDIIYWIIIIWRRKETCSRHKIVLFLNVFIFIIIAKVKYIVMLFFSFHDCQ